MDGWMIVYTAGGRSGRRREWSGKKEMNHTTHTLTFWNRQIDALFFLLATFLTAPSTFPKQTRTC